jgi:hypothetical protein
VALYSGQTFCIYMGCTDIDYCIYDICGFMDGFGFLLWLCVWICVWMCLWMYVWVCVWGMCLGMCMDTGSRSSARPGSINIGAYLSLGPVSIIIGTYSLLEARFYHHWVLLLYEAHFIIIGTYSFTRPISMALRIFPIFLDKKWKNLPQYAVSNKFF